MTRIPKENTKCRECIWSIYMQGKSVLASGYICKVNPFRSVVMGLDGEHYERRQHIQEEKKKK